MLDDEANKWEISRRVVISQRTDAKHRSVWRVGARIETELSAAMTRKMGRRTGQLVLLVAILATIGCDRVTKHVAEATLAGTPGRSCFGDIVRLAYAENPGGFLSLGAALPPGARTAVFTFATGLMLLALIVAAVRHRWFGWPALGLALFVAGGASNWIDRVTRGSVVDFITVGIGPLRTGVFNVADVAIMLGAGIFFFGELGDVRKRWHPPQTTQQ